MSVATSPSTKARYVMIGNLFQLDLPTTLQAMGLSSDVTVSVSRDLDGVVVVFLRAGEIA